MAAEFSTPDTRVAPRARQILTAIVDAYIASGEPVASHAIATALGNRSGMSPATIRNVMSELCEAGWLEQPHTSAGRVPTERAFRFFVDQLTSGHRGVPPELPVESRERLDGGFSGVHSAHAFLERTSHVLAEASSNVGITVTTGVDVNLLEHIYFSRLSSNKVLAVLVTRSGMVHDHALLLDRDLSQDDLESAAGYLNQNFRGWSLERIRAEMSTRLDRERNEYDRIRQSLQQSLVELCQKGALDHPTSAPSVFVDGIANLVANEQDRARLREVLGALEEKQKLVELIGAYVDAQQETVRVIVGLEDAAPELRNLVLVASPARLSGQPMGTIAVIGPKRMDYEHTIRAVSYVAQLLDRIVQGDRDGNEPDVLM